ncbi:MAG TPA: ribosomal protein S18-alanine N-acetyltransferase [Acidimicrobiales bacterium]|nr:ribosomal protein S18-alanine N-acetyltransferase [Acidimicrobiales bacterium]
MNDPFSLEISAMRRRDLRSVMVIEREVFPEPWSLNVFTSELALRRGRAYRVARDGRAVAGYFGMMFVEDEAHVTTIAVAPAFQRRGVATILMLEIVRIAREHGARHISLEVAEGNARAQALYRRFGFAPVGVRKRYYAVTGEDAYVMWAYDIDAPSYADRLASIEARVRSRQ